VALDEPDKDLAEGKAAKIYSYVPWFAKEIRTVHGGPYVGRRRAGARPGGWEGVSRAGGFGIGRVTGSSGARVTVAP